MQYKMKEPQFDEVIIELSYNCNLSCSMCGFGREVNPFDRRKFLSLENYQSILDILGDKCKAIRLNGRGESTIHPKFLEILELTKKQYPEIDIILFSNFSFHKDKILDAFIKYDVQLFISMDSPNDEELSRLRTGCNPKLIKKNIVKMERGSKRPFIICTIQEDNIQRIYEMAQFAFEHQCHILFNTLRRDVGIEPFVENIQKNKEGIRSQFEKVHQLYLNSGLRSLYPDQMAGIQICSTKNTQTHGKMDSCPILEKEICILYDGTVTPCNMFNPYRYGNIFQESLSEIWEGEARRAFLTSHKDNYYCQNCANLGR